MSVYLNGGAGVNDDVFPFIMTIKNDPYLQEHGRLVLAADLVAVYVRTGKLCLCF